MNTQLIAGCARVNITPDRSIFLYGYPYHERMSEGMHDPLFASAIYLDNGDTSLVFCAVDAIYVSEYITREVRRKVSAKHDIPERNIMIAASHTHSGPMTKDVFFADPVVPPVDMEYVDELISLIAKAVCTAMNNGVKAELAITTCSGKDVGGNRISKDGVIDSEVPVMVIRELDTKSIIAVKTIYCMHPTVLHEDNRLYSGDFTGYTRKYLCDNLGKELVYLYQTGPEGDQSPRHFVTSNTFEEAERLGNMLGERIVKSIREIDKSDYKSFVALSCESRLLELKSREFKTVAQAQAEFKAADAEYERLKKTKAPASEIRTAECARFGYDEAINVCRANEEGIIKKVLKDILPAEVSVFMVDNSAFVSLPIEIFVEYSLWIKESSPVQAFVSCLTNGAMDAYITTEEIEKQGSYEAAISLFPPAAGKKMVDAAVEMIKNSRKNRKC